MYIRCKTFIFKHLTHALANVSFSPYSYNQARKVAYIPFPFVHNQLTAFFVMIVVAGMPVLMLCFVNSLIAAIVMNFLSVTVFVGKINTHMYTCTMNIIVTKNDPCAHTDTLACTI